jgi:hypothetical protein
MLKLVGRHPDDAPFPIHTGLHRVGPKTTKTAHKTIAKTNIFRDTSSMGQASTA